MIASQTPSAQMRILRMNTTQVKRNSCKAVILDNDELLVVKKIDETGIYYVIPGGGQNWGEELHDTLKRECLEEVGIEPYEINELICIREFFGSKQTFPNANKQLHQIEFYFHCKVDRNKVCIGHEIDKKQIGIEWLKISNLKNERLFPEIIKDKIMKIMNNEDIKNIYVGSAD